MNTYERRQSLLDTFSKQPGTLDVLEGAVRSELNTLARQAAVLIRTDEHGKDA